MAFATVAILEPSDSTLAFFGLTNGEGEFSITNTKKGEYLLQVAFVSFKTHYQPITIDNKEVSVGIIIIKPNPHNLKEVQVKGERVPLLIKNDTIEYNSGAFRTKPDATAEELLKKMPGIEVDRAGNIKAQGQDVQKVLVDGKEFFGDDPKVATKNLPADAIDKVQVFERKSELTEFSGVDDGTREKTINLTLKEDKKSGYFGNVEAGGGTDNRYKTSAKVYRFKDDVQFGALGMLNNINQFGFTIQDYLNFKGGMRGMMSGGGSFRLELGGRNSLPISFGEIPEGAITSGAVGLNYTKQKDRFNRFNVNYMANGVNNSLMQEYYTKNFTESGSFETTESGDNEIKDRAHRFSLNYRKTLDTVNVVSASGSLNLTESSTQSVSLSKSEVESILLNQQNSNSTDNANEIQGNGRVAYTRKGNKNWPVLSLSAEGNMSSTLSTTDFYNITQFYNPVSELITDQNQRNEETLNSYQGSAKAARRLGEKLILQGEFSAGGSSNVLSRSQGIASLNENIIDSLSPSFTRDYQFLTPSLSLKRNTDKTQVRVELGLNTGLYNSAINNQMVVENQYQYFMPSAMVQHEFSTGKRITLDYNTEVNLPSVNQLLPVTNNFNALQLLYGNQNLKPEYDHSLALRSVIYDQFSFTSVFASIRAGYTENKINTSRTIGDNLAQVQRFINTPCEKSIRGNLDFSTPIRKIGTIVGFKIEERFSEGVNYLNNIENINSTASHTETVTLSNRKKEKWDGTIGVSATFSTSNYSVSTEYNNKYNSSSAFADLTYTPNDKWNFSSTFDLTNYAAASFDESIQIPLWSANVSYYFLKANRGVLTLEVFDILNKNTGLQRVAELNYLSQTQSNIIGRYAMLSFKYRLSKLADEAMGGMNFKMSRRRR